VSRIPRPSRWPVTRPLVLRAEFLVDRIRGVKWEDREVLAATFTRLYERGGWRLGSSVSGPGSDDAETSPIREALPVLFRDLGVRTLVDAPCGDANWITRIDGELEHYTGIDVVEPLISEVGVRHASPRRTFLVGDLCRDPLPQADALLCRDCLVHLPFDGIRAALGNFRASGATWLITTTYPDHRSNLECGLGRWRALNLCAPPFSFPPPERVIAERPDREPENVDKSLGVWRVSDLPLSATT